MDKYASNLTLREARKIYFSRHGFSENIYLDRWVKLMLGWIRIYFPNTSARKRAVQIHDLHHILTEYDTTLLGEAEIKAWELGSGGWQRHRIVLLFMLAAIPLGLWLDPRALWRAYRRGKNCRNLFDRECDDGILAETVGSVRARLGIIAA